MAKKHYRLFTRLMNSKAVDRFILRYGEGTPTKMPRNLLGPTRRVRKGRITEMIGPFKLWR